MQKDTQEEKENKKYKIFTGIIALIIGLWLAVPSLVSFFNFSPNSINFWINCISIILGVITGLAGIKSFKDIQKSK